MNGEVCKHAPSFWRNSLFAKSPALSALFWLCNRMTVNRDAGLVRWETTGTHDVHAELLASRRKALVEPVGLLHTAGLLLGLTGLAGLRVRALVTEVVGLHDC